MFDSANSLRSVPNMTETPTDATASGSENGGNLIRSAVLLLTILVISTTTRFYSIGKEALWTDEAATLRAAKGSLVDVFQQYHHYENTPPLYYVMLNAWMRVAGSSSDAIVRTPTAVSGIIAVMAVWFLARRMMRRDLASGFNRDLCSATAAFLVATSWLHIYFSQEARAYEPFVALATISCLTMLRFLEHPSAARMAVHVPVGLAMIYTHFAAAGVVVAQFIAGSIIVWRSAPEVRWKWIASQALIGLASLPLLPILLQTRRRMLAGTSRTIGNVFDRIWETMTFSIGSPWLGILLGVAIVLFFFSRNVSPARKVLVSGLIVLAPLIPLIGWFSGGAEYFPRHALFAYVAVAVAVGCGLTILPRHVAIIGSMLVCIASLHTLWVQQPQFRKPAMREAAAYVAHHAREGDTVMVSFMMAGWSFDRYFPRTDVRRRNHDDFTVGKIFRGQEGMQRLWLVLNPLPTEPRFLEIDNPMRVVNRTDFYLVTVVELERKPD